MLWILALMGIICVANPVLTTDIKDEELQSSLRVKSFKPEITISSQEQPLPPLPKVLISYMWQFLKLEPSEGDFNTFVNIQLTCKSWRELANKENSPFKNLCLYRQQIVLPRCLKEWEATHPIYNTDRYRNKITFEDVLKFYCMLKEQVSSLPQEIIQQKYHHYCDKYYEISNISPTAKMYERLDISESTKKFLHILCKKEVMENLDPAGLEGFKISPSRCAIAGKLIPILALFKSFEELVKTSNSSLRSKILENVTKNYLLTAEERILFEAGDRAAILLCNEALRSKSEKFKKFVIQSYVEHSCDRDKEKFYSGLVEMDSHNVNSIICINAAYYSYFFGLKVKARSHFIKFLEKTSPWDQIESFREILIWLKNLLDPNQDQKWVEKLNTILSKMN